MFLENIFNIICNHLNINNLRAYLFLETWVSQSEIMRNSKEWFSATELAGIKGLPSSPQGVNKKARTQDWKKKNREGVQGGAVEYHYSSLPTEVQQALGFTSEQITPPQKQTQQTQQLNDELLQRIKQLESNLATLMEMQRSNKLSNPPEGVDNEEWRLVCYYRQCNADRKMLAMSMLETLAIQAQAEQKREQTPPEARKVA